jgi:hypothetical protein
MDGAGEKLLQGLGFGNYNVRDGALSLLGGGQVLLELDWKSLGTCLNFAFNTITGI